MGAGGPVAAVIIVLFCGFILLDLTGNIDWQGAGYYWGVYQFLIYPLIFVIVTVLVIAVIFAARGRV